MSNEDEKSELIDKLIEKLPHDNKPIGKMIFKVAGGEDICIDGVTEEQGNKAGAKLGLVGGKFIVDSPCK
ncbi:hypothetical protein KVQ64_004307 [Vibrio vulnificus]|nr:hypothetical protein [Vibrio vulnificus]